LGIMQRLYTREQYLERIGWMKQARRPISITTDVIVGFPGESEDDFQQTLSLLEEVEYDGVFAFKYSTRPNTPAQKYLDHIPEQEKSRRLAVLMERQRTIQSRNNAKQVGQVLIAVVESRNEQRQQWAGRTSQNKVLNFVSSPDAHLRPGQFVDVRVTGSFPNSLLGEAVV
jgi:tRNA-2-methylthio-N6-dimethylallyladenosine synthase